MLPYILFDPALQFGLFTYAKIVLNLTDCSIYSLHLTLAFNSV